MAELVASIYSEALFEAAREDSMLEAVAEDFDGMIRAIEAEPLYFEVLKTPLIGKTEKVERLSEAFEDKVSQPFFNFLRLLVDKGRMPYLFDIKRDFDARIDDLNGVAKAVVTSVVPLTEDQLGAVKDNISRATGKTVELETQLDPELIGGMVIKMGDTILDASVKHKLDQLREEMMKVII